MSFLQNFDWDEIKMLSVDFIRENKNNLDEDDWLNLCRLRKFTDDELNEFSDNISFNNLFYKPSEDFLEKNYIKFDNSYFNKHILSDQFILRNYDRINIKIQSQHRLLGDDLLDKFKLDVDWSYISEKFIMTVSQIIKYKDYVDWNKISYMYDLRKFPQLNMNIKKTNNWLYLPSTYKIEQITKYFETKEINGKHFVIAYVTANDFKYTKSSNNDDIAFNYALKKSTKECFTKTKNMLTSKIANYLYNSDISYGISCYRSVDDIHKKYGLNGYMYDILRVFIPIYECSLVMLGENSVFLSATTIIKDGYVFNNIR